MVTWKKTTFKQRLIRLLDRLSNRLRPKHIRKGVHLVTVDQVETETLENGLEVTAVSFVSRCPYCGTDDWNTPKTKPDGSICNHPTKLRVVK